MSEAAFFLVTCALASFGVGRIRSARHSVQCAERHQNATKTRIRPNLGRRPREVGVILGFCPRPKRICTLARNLLISDNRWLLVERVILVDQQPVF
jgi:hypothetical protein